MHTNIRYLRYLSIVVLADRYDALQFEKRQGSLADSDGVHKYVEWWNAIHRWGLGPNAQSFKKDVEALWGHKQKDESDTIATKRISEDRAAKEANLHPATEITPPSSVNAALQGAMLPPTSIEPRVLRPIPALPK